MGRMQSALVATLIAAIIEIFVNSVCTTGWNPLVVIMVTVLVPIVDGAVELKFLLSNMDGACSG